MNGDFRFTLYTRRSYNTAELNCDEKRKGRCFQAPLNNSSSLSSVSDSRMFSTFLDKGKQRRFTISRLESRERFAQRAYTRKLRSARNAGRYFAAINRTPRRPGNYSSVAPWFVYATRKSLSRTRLAARANPSNGEYRGNAIYDPQRANRSDAKPKGDTSYAIMDELYTFDSIKVHVKNSSQN